MIQGWACRWAWALRPALGGLVACWRAVLLDDLSGHDGRPTDGHDGKRNAGWPSLD